MNIRAFYPFAEHKKGKFSMKKRIFSSILVIAMLASALMSCKDGEGDSSNATDTAAESTQQGTTEETVYPSELDNYAGTPAYTVDGDNIIVDGVSYPNKNNFNCGPMVATDDLGRELSTAEDTKNYSEEERQVGLFYFLWMGQHGDSGAFNMTEIIEKGGADAKFASYKGWGPVGAMHFFAEPLYGYYYSSDKWVIRKHVEELTNANIDFLYLDTTNGYAYQGNSRALMEVLNEMYQQGWDVPKVVFYTHTWCADTVNDIYSAIYKPNYCPDIWYMVDGKPLIIAYDKASSGADSYVTDPVQRNFFSFRMPQWPNEPSVASGGWPWMDFERPQRVFNYNGKADAVSVSIAQHSGTICFSDSAVYGNNSNRGRSFHNGRNDRSEKAYLYGYNFQEQWDIALESDAKYILVTSWNEWVAQRQNNPAKVEFVDTCDIEFSRDAEMMRGGYFDNYYMQLIENVRAAKGVAPTLVQDTRKLIDINGSFDQWNDILVTYSDLKGDTADRDSIVFGKQKVTDTLGRNDIVASKIVYDTKYAYFYVKTAEDISAFNTDSTWMQLFINADNATSGWYGFDYIVNHKASSANKTTLAKCTSSDNTFAFETAEEIDYKIEGNQMMVKVPLASLGITDYNKINFSFKWVDSEDVVDSMEEMYTSGDAAPHGRLNFVFQNHK